jgi:hypothetical protein
MSFNINFPGYSSIFNNSKKQQDSSESRQDLTYQFASRLNLRYNKDISAENELFRPNAGKLSSFNSKSSSVVPGAINSLSGSRTTILNTPELLASARGSVRSKDTIDRTSNMENVRLGLNVYSSPYIPQSTFTNTRTPDQFKK